MENLRGIDLNLLTVLDAVLSERHVSRAAARLGMSQPAVSNALERCRALFGDPLIDRHGREFTIEMTAGLAGQGEDAFFSVFLHDISERKRVEQALRNSEERFRTIVDNLAALVGEMTSDGVLVEMNRTALDCSTDQPIRN